MKILYIRTLYALNLKAGGSVGHTAGVINALDKCTDVEIYSNAELPEVNCNINIIRPICNKFLPHNIKELILNFQFLFSMDINKIKPDAIYQRHTAASFLGAYWANKYNIPLILEFNSSEIWKINNWKQKDSFLRGISKKIFNCFIQEPMIRAIENYNLRMANVIVVVSKALKEDLVGRGIKEEKILINPNGVDIEKFHPNCGGDEIRKKFNLEDKKIVGFIGTFGQWHGVEELAKAIVLFFEKHREMEPNVRFLLIGNGVLFDKVKAILKQGKCEDKVIFTGLVLQNEAPYYLDACDIFVSPHIPNSDGSQFFGSPTKLFEYMAMGKGIVASNLGQIGYILDDGITGRLVEPGNSEQLENGIFELLNNEKLCKKMGLSARKKVIEHYTWGQHVRRILEKLNVNR